ncbi:MAG: hypothetical protein Q8N94_04875 [Methanoregula sp.]|nr:hypothetical protein [Methanoregula sp.]
MTSFFEESIKFIENSEKESSKAKIIELSKIFANQFKELEDMKRKTNWSYLATLAGLIIGVCSLLFVFVK